MRFVISASDLCKAVVLAGGVAAILFSAPASRDAVASPVSCAFAKHPAEFTVCNNEELLFLHETLQMLRNDRLKTATTTPQQQQIKRDKMRWVGKRNACGGDETCLETRYQAEIEQVRGNVLGFSN